jgi:hypothetical protein
MPIATQMIPAKSLSPCWPLVGPKVTGGNPSGDAMHGR